MATAMDTHRDISALLERAQAGSREAFDGLITALGPALKRHVRTRIGEHLRSRVEVEDVLQETYTRAWKSVGGVHWTGESALFSWFKRLAERVILNLVSRHRRDEVIFVEDEACGPAPGPSPSTACRRDERFSRLEEAISSLSPEYREVVRLVRIDGLKVKEAAARMNRSPNAVMHLLLRALKKLKETFGDTESLHLPPRRLGSSKERGVELRDE
jgi:RNA polymerase sigma-70 factor (ECF subfamily)